MTRVNLQDRGLGPALRLRQVCTLQAVVAGLAMTLSLGGNPTSLLFRWPRARLLTG